ncbi:MAG: hypothetical protein P4L16_07675 [Chlamydiales bacterium]|nr:hypothetical protein [Chlamydiales bacterium]
MKKITLLIVFASLLASLSLSAAHPRKKHKEHSINFSFNVNYGSPARKPSFQRYRPIAYAPQPTVIILDDSHYYSSFYRERCYPIVVREPVIIRESAPVIFLR